MFYLKSINYLLESLFYIQKRDKFEEVLSFLKAETDAECYFVNQNTQVLSSLYWHQHSINLFYMKGAFKEGLLFVPQVLDEMKSLGKKIDNHHVMLFYYKIACLYFGASDYRNCIYFLAKIVDNKSFNMREDLLCYTRVLYLVAHYESGQDENIEELIRDTYKFLLKMNNLYEVQRKMIKFLRKLSDLYPHELKEAFAKLYKDLKVFEEHPYEKKSLFVFRYIVVVEIQYRGFRCGNCN